MLIGRKRKLGRHLNQISTGEKLAFTESIKEKDLLLYLGLTEDANPLYLQPDYAALTPYKKPVIPPFLLTGLVMSAVSKYLPGPGSHVIKQEFSFPKPAYHSSKLDFILQVEEVNEAAHTIIVKVQGVHGKDLVIEGLLTVCPPYHPDENVGLAFENF
ncbi:enoyl-CoA hydratase [Metabacillus sp. GX 13764]|uniref:MaoC/PaaZ C-terminal domain-containing protein n=1 Tax=Metabacillus kandeliae TaxID=2900151 RepID=UPI001E5BACC3|nr:MaoC/PaaZ C-terminal domain-containing protein [Metabacillus kandeliae]MCD7032802.1 enoyl-CoA hydratase [Metabacillus kandeliae]